MDFFFLQVINMKNNTTVLSSKQRADALTLIIPQNSLQISVVNEKAFVLFRGKLERKCTNEAQTANMREFHRSYHASVRIARW